MSYYEILEVSQNASKEVIKAAYKSLMQRYHPDRNPGNAEIAERASLVVQAYEVLSDPDKRAAYDLQFKDQSQDLSDNIHDKSRGVRGPAGTSGRRGAKASKSYWYVWLLIVLIVFSSWIILSLTKKRQSAESELKEIRQSLAGKQLSQEQLQEKIKRMDAILQTHPEILKKEANAKASEEEARTIPLFISQLTIHLKNPEKPVEEKIKSSDEPGKAQEEQEKVPGEPVKSPAEPVKSAVETAVSLGDTGKSSADSGHILSIPVLGVKVGSIDPEKVVRHLQSKADLISQRLAEKLAYARYDELIKIDGEEYLKKIILDTIGDTTGTDRFANYPPSSTESPGRYGVVDVFFPEDYVVR